ncbi:MAG: hypothetical protein K2F87_01680 [Muribaculaceae bacterium]|nr:hypothetical protein [Muribaculaceae bacterium]
MSGCKALSSVLLASGAFLLPASALADYQLDLSRGRFPAGVTVENANGVLPEVSGYKHGYTADGWMVDRLYDYGYVAVSPTWTNGKGACENILTLPPVKIDEAPVSLHWTATAVYKYFTESYRVEAFVDGGEPPVILYETENAGSSPGWSEVFLEEYAGHELTVRFVTTSSRGYLLALQDVGIGEPITGSAPPDLDKDYPAPDPFKKKYLVDHGTGIWCVNCPASEVEIDKLKYRFGNSVIPLNTHVRDALGNEAYWEELKWYSVPRMMLNRNRATEGESASKFEMSVDDSSTFAINFTELGNPEGRLLEAVVRVKVAESVDNSDGRYRVAYVVTGDFHDPDNIEFAQKNNCTMPAYGPYYYLPSTIPPVLMYYEDVTLTSETAFTGIEGSLPVALTAGEEYEVKWQVEVPELLADPAGARVVAFVLDTVTGEVQNVDALRVGEEPQVEVRGVSAASPQEVMTVTSEGLRLNIPSGEAYLVELYSVSGGLAASFGGISEGYGLLRPSVAPGIYIANLTSATSRCSRKVIIR